MTLSAQKYPNTFRTVSGLINTVYDNDVILLCDTSLGAVTIDLALIPADSWNTVYKLYVVDKSNNAGVNNITIKAPLGYTVNNASTFVVNVNSGCAIVRITSNTSYVAETNYGFPSGLAVQNEGVSITASATTMNFVGGGVNATAVGGFVTIDIAGTAVVPVTNAQLLTLISTNAIVPNTWYLVSDAIFTVTLNDTVPILVQGITVNSVSLSGSGIFLNADYQQVGNYSGVTGFVANIGVWQDTQTPVIGDVVMWNNLHYVNLTGVNTVLPNTPQTDPVNWSVLAKTTTNGYIQEIDDITYDPKSNNILSRTDKRNNEVQNNPNNYTATMEAFYVFQWGNNQTQSNVVNSDSDFTCWNNIIIGTPAPLFVPAIFSNTVSGFSQVEVSNQKFGTFRNNTFDQNVTLTVLNSGTFEKNNFEQTCSGSIENKQQAVFTNNLFFQSVGAIDIVNNKPSGLINNNVFRYARNVNIALNENTIERNVFDNSSVSITSNTGSITENYLFRGGLNVVTINGGVILNNYIEEGNFVTNTNLGTISLNTLESSTCQIIQLETNSFFRGNRILKGSVYASEILRSNSNVEYNIIESQSRVVLTEVFGSFGSSTKGMGNVISTSEVTIGTIDATCNFASNVIEQASTVQFLQLSFSGSVTTNTFSKSSVDIEINSNEIAGCEFISITWAGGLPNAQQLSGGNTASYINTITYSIDLSDPTIYDLLSETLTIPINLRTWVGTFRLLNSTGLVIKKIDGLLDKNAFCFFPDSGSVTFNSVAVAGVIANQIVSSSGATSYLLTSHSATLYDKIYIATDASATINTVFLTSILL